MQSETQSFLILRQVVRIITTGPYMVRALEKISSSSSCSGRISFDSCSLYPQNEIGLSISSSVVLCVFVVLVYIVVLV